MKRFLPLFSSIRENQWLVCIFPLLRREITGAGGQWEPISPSEPSLPLLRDTGKGGGPITLVIKPLMCNPPVT